MQACCAVNESLTTITCGGLVVHGNLIFGQSSKVVDPRGQNMNILVTLTTIAVSQTKTYWEQFALAPIRFSVTELRFLLYMFELGDYFGIIGIDISLGIAIATSIYHEQLLHRRMLIGVHTLVIWICTVLID